MRTAWIVMLLTLLLVSLGPLHMMAAPVDQAHPTDCCPSDNHHDQGTTTTCPHALACGAWLSVAPPFFAASRTPALAFDGQPGSTLAPSQAGTTDPPPPRA